MFEATGILKSVKLKEEDLCISEEVELYVFNKRKKKKSRKRNFLERRKGKKNNNGREEKMI